MYKKGLVLAIIVLFTSASFQPIIAEKNKIISVENESNYGNVDFDEAKEYLFQTIIDISNNPEVKELLKQSNQRIFSSDYDFKDVFLQLLFKKPRLLKSILYTRPKMTIEYLDKSYNRGIEFVNIVGEEQALDILDSIKISNPDLLNEFNNIIKNNWELSYKELTLKTMNNNLKFDTPFGEYPILCAIAKLLLISLFFLFMFFEEFVHDYSNIYPILSNLASKAGVATLLLFFLTFAFISIFCEDLW